MQSLNYDSTKMQTVGLGKPSGGSTPLVSLSGTTGQYTQIALVAGEYTLNGPDNAGFDIQNRLLYQYADSGSGEQLVVINVDTGKGTTVPFVDGSSVVPATIAFFN